MRFLADENFPGAAVAALRNRGHDVRWILEDDPGCLDSEVLARASSERRILLTFDKDFGELVFQAGRGAADGVILFRLSAISPGFISDLAVRVLESRDDWSGHFSVIEEFRIRMTQLP